jgi:hypothetical protein
MLWTHIDLDAVKPGLRASCEGRADIATIYRHYRRFLCPRLSIDRGEAGPAVPLAYEDFRDEFIALCNAIGLRTKKLGGKDYVLMPKEPKLKRSA